MRSVRGVLIASSIVASAGCATSPVDADLPYVATYRPLEARPGEFVVSGTAELVGRLTVQDGCVAVQPPEGPARLVAFAPQVQATVSGGRTGIVDSRSGARAWLGDTISVGGSSPPNTSDFISQRFVTPPPATCPTALFVSNSGFARR